MKKLFWDDPYQRELTTRVAQVNGDQVLFEETIAYSFAGGQESDTATVNHIVILDSRREDTLIYYTLPENHGLSVGDAVQMVIGWPRRHALMRLHFAAELILELVTRMFGYEKIGAHISQTKSRIDFIAQESIKAHLPAILAEYDAIIKADLPIEKGFSDVVTQRRYWKIEGFAQVPCGGTHVNTTGEVGFVTLKREHPGKSIERIEIRLVDDTIPNH